MNLDFLLIVLKLYLLIGFGYTLGMSDMNTKGIFVYRLKRSKSRLSLLFKIIMYPTVPFNIIILNILLLTLFLLLLLLMIFVDLIDGFLKNISRRLKSFRFIEWLTEDREEK